MYVCEHTNLSLKKGEVFLSWWSLHNVYWARIVDENSSLNYSVFKIKYTLLNHIM